MLEQADLNELFKRSYTRGMVVFCYGVVWVGAALAGFLLIGRLFPAESGLILILFAALGSAALAGALGGATAALSRLDRHLPMARDFQRQSLALYFLLPVSGLVVGVLSLILITIPGSLMVNYATTGTVSLGQMFQSSTFIATQILLAWVSGFYQEQGLAKIKSLTRGLLKQPDPVGQLPPAQAKAAAKDSPFAFKAWYQRRLNVTRWSYTWGLFILIYGVTWLVGLILVYMQFSPLVTAWAAESQATLALALAAWSTAAAGGMGGVISLLNYLYRHVSMRQDFDRQHLISYLVQPIVGFVFGVALYFFVASGYLSLKSLVNPEAAPMIVDAPTLIMAQLALGFAVGFRQHSIADLIRRLVRDVASLFKLIGRFLHPKNLFKQARRVEILAEIERETSVFKPVSQERSPNDTKWWMPD